MPNATLDSNIYIYILSSKFKWKWAFFGFLDWTFSFSFWSQRLIILKCHEARYGSGPLINGRLG